MQVRAIEDQTGYTGNWTARVYAICADPLPGLEWVTDTSSASSEQEQIVPVTCPAGKRRLGGGFAIHALGTSTPPIGLGSLLPSPLGDGPPGPTGTVAMAFEADSGFSGDWSLRSEAICANE